MRMAAEKRMDRFKQLWWQDTQEMRVQFLGQEDHVEEEMATLSSILARKIPWTGDHLTGYSLWFHKELDTTEHSLTGTGSHAPQ